VHFSGCKTHITSGPRFFFHYDLGFNLVDEGETLLVECDYNTTLFDGETIRYWIAGFKTLLESISENSNQSISQILMLNEGDRPKISKRPKTRISTRSSNEDQPAQAEYVAPSDGVEQKLAQIWTTTLNIDRISNTANFFELGGQSLQAVSLFAKIEETFGKKLPLATLFNAPTIHSLANVLEGQGGSSWSPLVAINPNGSKPPLFLVHGAGGNILLYRSLAEHLSPHYPLYGLQSKGLDGSEPLHTIEEMAECYVCELRSVQPKGPYYLGGYCLGGTIAYEMAQILSREGEEVALVAMLDTYNYSLALKVSFRSFLYQKAKFHLANLGKLRLKDMVEYLREKVRLGFGGELANLKTSMPGSSEADGVCRAESGAEAAVQSINDYAAEHYNPRQYPGCVTLFKPRINYKFYPDPNMGWGDLAASLDIVEVAQNPHSMLLEPYVRVLAAQLKERIDGGTIQGRMLPPESELMENMIV
jgi:thioesterase domain-containing protein/acyl carrier protein